MANEENLQPFKKGEQRQKDLGRAGGIKSGQVKREKKLFKEVIEEQLGDTIDSIVASMIYEASQKGNVQAATWLRDTAGQKPVEKQEISTEIPIIVNKVDK